MPTTDEEARRAFRHFLEANELQGASQEDQDRMWKAFHWAWIPKAPIDFQFVLDGPPSGHECGCFVEVIDADGRSTRVGRWHEREGGSWVLQVHRPGANDA